MHPFVENLRLEWPPEKWVEERTVIAVSGGADSVALMRAMVELAGERRDRLTVAHFNHRLRGWESNEDEVYVRKWALQCGLDCQVGQAEPSELKKSGQDGIEAAARSARYAFLRQKCDELGARYLLTAHTADDHVETVLHRILRGTGLIGLEGIQVARELSGLTMIIRPMLGATRQDVVNYLEDIRQPHREDASNADPAFTRNRIRRLLPELEKQFNPRVRSALVTLSMQAAHIVDWFDEVTDDWHLDAVASEDDTQVTLDLKFLQAQPEPLVRHFLVRLWQELEWPLQGMTFEHWESLADLLSGDPDGPPSIDLPGGLRARLSHRATQVVIQLPS